MTTNTLPATVEFSGASLAIIDHAGQPWLSAADLARALGYANTNAVTRIYARNQGEFTDAMTGRVNLTLPNQRRDTVPVRIFSPRGCHLVAMFARTPRAAAFRRWVLDVLEGLAMPKPIAPPILTVATLRSAILAEDSDPVDLPDAVQAALDAKAARFAVTMLELSRQHLARRVVGSALRGRQLDTAAALDAIADTELGDVLAPHAMAQLRMVRRLAQTFAAIAADACDDIDDRYVERPAAMAAKPEDQA